MMAIYPSPYDDYDKYPNWWEYQFTTGDGPQFNLCDGADNSGDDHNTRTHSYEFKSAEAFISWLDGLE